MAEQLLLDLGRTASYAAHDFLPAPNNRDAIRWLERYPAWPGPALVLYGPAGSGKSHLARIFRERTGAPALDPADLPGPGQRPAAGPLVLDPAVPVHDEAALLHLHTWLTEQGGHLLLTAPTPVAAWGLRLPDLDSRLRAAPAVELGPPDDALLAALLVKLFDDRQVRVEAGVIAYLVRRMERSYAAARGIVAALDAMSLRERRPITRALAGQLLSLADEEAAAEPARRPGGGSR